MPLSKIILAGGGTGGHIYPAIAIAQSFKKKYPDVKILFAGTKHGMENDLVKKAGFCLKPIRVKGFKRKLSFDTFVSMKELALGAFDSYKLLKSERPDIVVGTGGYVAGPVILFASLMGIPGVIHEQNVIPGITNKILAKFVKKIFISFSDSIKYFPKQKTVLTGNPIREQILEGKRNEALKQFGLRPDLPVVLCFGGSQGAACINDAVIEAIDLINNQKIFQLIHITGKNHYEKILKIMANKGIDLKTSGHIIVKPYIYNMQDAYAACDLVISRAGAITISEICLCGKPAILIPLAIAANNHQDYNARFMEKNGAAVVITEKELSGIKLFEKIMEIISDKRCLKQMSAASKKLAIADAAEKIVEETAKLVK